MESACVIAMDLNVVHTKSAQMVNVSVEMKNVLKTSGVMALRNVVAAVVQAVPRMRFATITNAGVVHTVPVVIAIFVVRRIMIPFVAPFRKQKKTAVLVELRAGLTKSV